MPSGVSVSLTFMIYAAHNNNDDDNQSSVHSAERIQKLKEFRWQFGSLLPDAVLKNMSEDEVKWYRDYCGVLQNYMRRLNEGRGLDLTLHKKPPKRLYVQVRCLTDYGEFELDDGTSVVLTKGSTVSDYHFKYPTDHNIC